MIIYVQKIKPPQRPAPGTSSRHRGSLSLRVSRPPTATPQNLCLPRTTTPTGTVTRARPLGVALATRQSPRARRGSRGVSRLWASHAPTRIFTPAVQPRSCETRSERAVAWDRLHVPADGARHRSRNDRVFLMPVRLELSQRQRRRHHGRDQRHRAQLRKGCPSAQRMT